MNVTTTRTLRTASAAAALVLAGGFLLAGCGDDSTPASPGASTSSSPAGDTSPAASGTTVAVSIKGDQVTPNGKRIKTTVGEPITLTVDSDRAGELHVHSTPEQELAYEKGSTTLHVTIDKPGIVDIEDHIADVVVVQLEVS